MASTSLDALDTSLDLALLLSLPFMSSREALSDELLSLSAIYSSLSLYKSNSSNPITSSTTLRLTLETTIAPSTPTTDDSELPLKLLLSIAPSYPDRDPPQLQLLSIYLGPYAVSDALFGQVLRCYMHERGTVSREDSHLPSGVEWNQGQVGVFEGVEWVRERCREWYDGQIETKGQSQIGGGGSAEEEEEPDINDVVDVVEQWDEEEWKMWEREKESRRSDSEKDDSNKMRIWSSEPIVDRKSVFVGHATSVHSQAEVDAVMSELLSDKKIAKASHNISAYRFYDSTTNALHHDVDDDGETAAGGRIGHLLTLLEVENVLVVVTRWYGGIHLGADRFKDINQAARDALTAGGFVGGLDSAGGDGKKKGNKKR